MTHEVLESESSLHHFPQPFLGLSSNKDRTLRYLGVSHDGRRIFLKDTLACRADLVNSANLNGSQWFSNTDFPQQADGGVVERRQYR